MRRSWLAGTLLFVAAPLVLAAPVGAQSSVRTEIDTAVVTVGDRVTLSVSVGHAAASQARLADSLALEPFEVIELRALPVATTDRGVTSGWTLVLAAFELGELELPSFDVEVVSSDGSIERLETDRYIISVESVGVDESGDIRDIRGPLGIPLSSWQILLWVLLPLLLAALLYALVRRLRPAKGGAGRPALGPLTRPPHEVALEALTALEATSLLERGRVKEYHIAASDILRTYIEERFRVEALEMTTREVLTGLAEAEADASLRVDLRTFLEACDLVKFAKVRPDTDTSRVTLELGRRIVIASVPAPDPDPVAVAVAVEAS